MPDSAAIVKFQDRAIRPPKGQWHYTIGGGTVTRYSESEIIDEIRKWQKNNGAYTSDLEIERALWSYYCEREPKRCRGYRPDATRAEAAALVPRDLNPRVEGPWIWQALNLAAVKFRKEFFVPFCTEILDWLECPNCRLEWRDILRSDSPEKLTNAKEACVWVNRVHNRVNRRIGKPLFSYEQGVREYGFPL